MLNVSEKSLLNHFVTFLAAQGSTDAVVQKCFVKKVFLKIPQNSQEKTCAGVTLLIKLQASGLQLYHKRDSGTGVFLRCFPVNFNKFLRAPFLQNTSGGCFWKYEKLKNPIE